MKREEALDTQKRRNARGKILGQDARSRDCSGTLSAQVDGKRLDSFVTTKAARII